MQLVDIMSHAGLAGYAEAAMILFLVAFLVIVVATLLPSRHKGLDADGRLPFEDDPASGREEEHRS